MPPSPTAFEQLVDIMKQLRDPETGCPWDLEQSFETIAPYTIEEAYEVADAIERRDHAELKEELGDLLLQVVFHSQIADEADLFDVNDVAAAISQKMLRRHPHVFADAGMRSSEQQTAEWEAIKAAERAQKREAGEPTSALDGVAKALPALMRAEKLQKRAARTGFDWTNATDILDKLDEESGEVKDAISGGVIDEIEDEIGDLLFVAANLARRFDLDPEIALRKANAKFERRFRAMEKLAGQRGQDFSALSLAEQDSLWKAVKRQEA